MSFDNFINNRVSSVRSSGNSAAPAPVVIVQTTPGTAVQVAGGDQNVSPDQSLTASASQGLRKLIADSVSTRLAMQISMGATVFGLLILAAYSPFSFFSTRERIREQHRQTVSGSNSYRPSQRRGAEPAEYGTFERHFCRGRLKGWGCD